jgi:hypothetical protein
MAATNQSLVYSTQITHIGSGASMAANVMSGTADISTALDSTNLARYPLADIALMVSNTGSVSSASNYILLYRRDMNFDGTNDEPVPATATSAAWSNHLVGSFTIPPWTVASTTYLSANDIPLSDQCQFYIENKTNTGIGLGWTLKVTPKTNSYA